MCACAVCVCLVGLGWGRRLDVGLRPFAPAVYLLFLFACFYQYFFCSIIFYLSNFYARFAWNLFFSPPQTCAPSWPCPWTGQLLKVRNWLRLIDPSAASCPKQTTARTSPRMCSTSGAAPRSWSPSAAVWPSGHGFLEIPPPPDWGGGWETEEGRGVRGSHQHLAVNKAVAGTS